MSDSPQDGNHVGTQKHSLRDELASLRIERKPASRQESYRAEAYRPTRPARSGGFFRKLFSAAIWLLPLALIGGGAYYGYMKYKTLRPVPEVVIDQVRTMTLGEAEKLLTAKGYLKSLNQALVGAKVPGRVEQLRVVEGQKVKKGELLAVLEHADLDAALESRKATVQRAEADVREAQADLLDKERRAIRAVRLHESRSASTEEVEQARTAQAMASARVASMQAAVALARAQVVEAQKAIENMFIYAPFSGTILKKEAELGETISTMSMGGSNTRSAIANLADLEHMEVETDVSENLLAPLVIGQPAEIQVSAVPDQRFDGRVQRVIPMGDRTRGTVKVMVEVLDPGERLFPELVATVHFLPAKKTGAEDAEDDSKRSGLFVSRKAIVEEDGKSYAWVVERARVVKRPVETGEGTDELARIEAGLEPGQRVVLNPPEGLIDGEKVREAQ